LVIAPMWLCARAGVWRFTRASSSPAAAPSGSGSLRLGFLAVFDGADSGDGDDCLGAHRVAGDPVVALEAALQVVEHVVLCDCGDPFGRLSTIASRSAFLKPWSRTPPPDPARAAAHGPADDDAAPALSIARSARAA
jgi:hypothetical protein